MIGHTPQLSHRPFILQSLQESLYAVSKELRFGKYMCLNSFLTFGHLRSKAVI